LKFLPENPLSFHTISFVEHRLSAEQCCGTDHRGRRLAVCAVVRILSNSFDPSMRVVAKHWQIAETPRWEHTT
jgi:hypothetical protein